MTKSDMADGRLRWAPALLLTRRTRADVARSIADCVDAGGAASEGRCWIASACGGRRKCGEANRACAAAAGTSTAPGMPVGRMRRDASHLRWGGSSGAHRAECRASTAYRGCPRPGGRDHWATRSRLRMPSVVRGRAATTSGCSRAVRFRGQRRRSPLGTNLESQAITCNKIATVCDEWLRSELGMCLGLMSSGRPGVRLR